MSAVTTTNTESWKTFDGTDIWLGEWVVQYLENTYSLLIPDFVTWDIQGVPILPAVLGSAIILLVVTSFLSWGRYQR